MRDLDVQLAYIPLGLLFDLAARKMATPEGCEWRLCFP